MPLPSLSLSFDHTAQTFTIDISRSHGLGFRFDHEQGVSKFVLHTEPETPTTASHSGVGASSLEQPHRDQNQGAPGNTDGKEGHAESEIAQATRSDGTGGSPTGPANCSSCPRARVTSFPQSADSKEQEGKEKAREKTSWSWPQTRYFEAQLAPLSATSQGGTAVEAAVQEAKPCPPSLISKAEFQEEEALSAPSPKPDKAATGGSTALTFEATGTDGYSSPNPQHFTIFEATAPECEARGVSSEHAKQRPPSVAQCAATGGTGSALASSIQISPSPAHLDRGTVGGVERIPPTCMEGEADDLEEWFRRDRRALDEGKHFNRLVFLSQAELAARRTFIASFKAAETPAAAVPDTAGDATHLGSFDTFDNSKPPQPSPSAIACVCDTASLPTHARPPDKAKLLTTACAPTEATTSECRSERTIRKDNKRLRKALKKSRALKGLPLTSQTPTSSE